MIGSDDNLLCKFPQKCVNVTTPVKRQNQVKCLQPLSRDTVEISSSNQYRDITQNMLAQREKIKLSKDLYPLAGSDKVRVRNALRIIQDYKCRVNIGIRKDLTSEDNSYYSYDYDSCDDISKVEYNPKLYDTIVNQSRIPRAVKLYRGCSPLDFGMGLDVSSEEFLDKYFKEGKDFVCPIFPETSLDRKIGERFAKKIEDSDPKKMLLVINAPKGTKGVYMGYLGNESRFDDEKEIFLKRNLIFRFKSRQSTPDYEIVEVDIVGNNPFKKKYKFWECQIDPRKTEFAKIKDLDFVIKKFGSRGLPLMYSREDFVKDLKNELSALNESRQNEILDKLGIKFNEYSYENIISTDKLDENNKTEAKIKKLCEKFILKNEIKTGDKQADEFLNQVIKDFPDVINIIGKKQHPTHQYTLDGHSFKVLKEIVSHPDFEKLSPDDKLIMQIMALFHDIGKREGIPDKQHEKTSSEITEKILKKYKLPFYDKKRICKLIKNHNWLEQVNKGIITQEVKELFKDKSNELILKIFTEADLKSVSDDFYECFSPLIEPSIEKIKKQ